MKNYLAKIEIIRYNKKISKGKLYKGEKYE